jgi:hypothetical protein
VEVARRQGPLYVAVPANDAIVYCVGCDVAVVRAAAEKGAASSATPLDPTVLRWTAASFAPQAPPAGATLGDANFSFVPPAGWKQAPADACFELHGGSGQLIVSMVHVDPTADPLAAATQLAKFQRGALDQICADAKAADARRADHDGITYLTFDASCSKPEKLFIRYGAAVGPGGKIVSIELYVHGTTAGGPDAAAADAAFRSLRIK